MASPVNGCTVSGILSFVLRMSQIYGVAPLRFKRVYNGWRMFTSRGAFIYEIIAFLLICTYIVALTTTTFYRDGYWSYWDRVTSLYLSRLVSALAVVMVLIAQMYSGIPKMETVISCLGQLQKLKSELNKYGAARPYENTQRVIVMYSLISVHILSMYDTGIFIYRIAFEFSHPVDYFAQIMLLLAHNIKILMAKVLILQISLILTNVFLSFNHLNNCLDNLLDPIPITKKSSHRVYKTINNIGYLYCCLHEVVQALDENYGTVLIPLIMYFLLHLIRALYILINKLIAGSIEVDLGTLQFLWAAQYFGDMLLVVEPCQRTRKQMKRTKRLLSRLMRDTDPNDSKLLSELDFFYKQLVTNDSVFVPMNMCELNRAVIITVFGTIITYLVIVLQVHYR